MLAFSQLATRLNADYPEAAPGFGSAAELPTSSPAWRRHGGCSSRRGAAHVTRGNRRAAPASTDPEILAGEPVFTGTRGPLRNLFEYLEAGDSLEVFLDAFPDLTREQAVAALEMAREAVTAGATSR